jgi:hypothetical protein
MAHDGGTGPRPQDGAGEGVPRRQPGDPPPAAAGGPPGPGAVAPFPAGVFGGRARPGSGMVMGPIRSGSAWAGHRKVTGSAWPSVRAAGAAAGLNGVCGAQLECTAHPSHAFGRIGKEAQDARAGPGRAAGQRSIAISERAMEAGGWTERAQRGPTNPVLARPGGRHSAPPPPWVEGGLAPSRRRLLLGPPLGGLVH